MNFDVFVSYRSADSDRVMALVCELRRSGVEVFVDQDGVREFDDIQEKVAFGLSACKVFVVWYSKTYLESYACQWELMTALGTGNRERLLVVNPEEDDEHILPTDLKSLRYSDCAELQKLAERIRQKAGEFETKLGCSAATHPQFFGAELTGSAQFFGRIRELFLLHGALQQHRAPMLTGQQRTIVQLQGIAGVGKTLLAAEYGYRFQLFYPGGVFWLRGPGADEPKGALDTSVRQTVLRQNLQGIFQDLEMEGDATSIRELRARLGERLSSMRPSLWIVDDMPTGLKDSEFLEWVSPHPSTPTLVTIRAKGHSARGATLELNGFSPEEGRALLIKHGVMWSAEQEGVVQGTLKAIGFHPLATVLSASYISARGISIEKYLDELLHPSADVLETAARFADVLPHDCSPAICSVLRRSFEPLDRNARILLMVASCLSTAKIAMPLLENVMVSLDDMEPDVASVEAAAAAKRAAQLSLADSNLQKRWFTVHPLVARAARHFPSGDIDLELLRLTASMCLCTFLDFTLGKLSNVRKVEAEVEHARALLPFVEPIVQSSLLMHIGRFELYAGNPARALEILTSASHGVPNFENDVSEGALRLRNKIAASLHETADYAGALRVYDLVVKGCISQYGAEDPGTLVVMANRTWTLFKFGNVVQARQHMESIVSRLREVLDDSHLAIRTYRAGLADIEREAGNPKGAATQLEELYTASLLAFGRGHKETISVGIKFARALAACGDMARAIELQTEILVFARQHERLRIEAGVDAAGTLLATQEHKKALTVLEVLEAVRRAEPAFGLHHPITIQAAFYTWRCLSDVGRAEEALSVFSRYLSWLMTVDPAPLGLTRQRILHMLTPKVGTPPTQPKVDQER